MSDLDRRRAFEPESFPPAVHDLTAWMEERRQTVCAELDAFWPLDDLFVTEVMTDDRWTIADGEPVGIFRRQGPDWQPVAARSSGSSIASPAAMP